MSKLKLKKRMHAARARLLSLQGNMTLRVFSDKCGIGQSTLHNYLHGRQVRFEFIEQICKACNVNVGWFVTGKGPKSGNIDEVAIAKLQDVMAATGKLIYDLDKIRKQAGMMTQVLLEKNIKELK